MQRIVVFVLALTTAVAMGFLIGISMEGSTEVRVFGAQYPVTLPVWPLLLGSGLILTAILFAALVGMPKDVAIRRSVEPAQVTGFLGIDGAKGSLAASSQGDAKVTVGELVRLGYEVKGVAEGVYGSNARQLIVLQSGNRAYLGLSSVGGYLLGPGTVCYALH